jgi:hypothetical protein
MLEISIAATVSAGNQCWPLEARWMRTELISIATKTLPLDGAFYLPEAEPAAR